MMRSVFTWHWIALLGIVGSATGEPLKASWTNLQQVIHSRSAGALVEEAVAAEQADALARNRTQSGIELRPGLDDEEGRLALRLYLPSRWTHRAMTEQQKLVEQAALLRMADLERQELLAVCRSFCTYRMLLRQGELYAAELAEVKASLEQADRGVQQHQFSTVERARLYGHYLGLLNEKNRMDLEQVNVRGELFRVLGSDAQLETLASSVRIALPTRSELGELVEFALSNRSDYRLMETEAETFRSAEAMARAEDGFRLKYIQSEFRTATDGGGEDWGGVSAAFSFPIGARSPDAAAYRQKRILTQAAMTLQRRLIEEHLLLLLDQADALEKHLSQQQAEVQPLVEQITSDLTRLDDAPLGQFRARMQLREDLLDAALQVARAERELELIAVDLAETLGAVHP